MRNKAVMKKWIEALRSGEYKQGLEALRNGDRYCCLGVLCDLYAREHPSEPQWELRSDDQHYFLGEEVELPDKVREWVGLEHGDGSVEINDLVVMNDTGRSFDYIANFIEKDCFGNSKGEK